MALARKNFKHNPTARLNDTTGMVDLTVGGKTYDLDPEQASFIGELLRDLGARAKARFPAQGFIKQPIQDDEPVPGLHVPDEHGFVAQDFDASVAREAHDGATGEWAIPKDDSGQDVLLT